MAVDGAHRISVDTPCLDALTPTAFQSLIDTEDQGPLVAAKMVQQEEEEKLAHFSGRPAGPIEHVMVLGETGLLSQTQDPQSRRDGALAWGEDRPNQEQLSFGPGLGMEQWHERA